MKTPLKCPKCGGEMQEGFVRDNLRPVYWTFGKPKLNLLGWVKTGNYHRIESYRCVGCGYVESYAQEEKMY